MKTWFLILGWSLSILTMTGNGFIICLVCNKRRLRTKTNAFIVSLAVADFCVGMSAFPLLHVCIKATMCNHLHILVSIVRNFFAYASVTNLCSLVLDRYIAVVKPLKYLAFMSRRRVIQMVLFSWVIPAAIITIYTLEIFLFKVLLFFRILMWLITIFFEFLPSAMLIFFFVSMLRVVIKQNRTARSLKRQLSFNHRVSFKAQEKSSIVMMAIVISVFLVCYGFYLRCSIFVIFSDRYKFCPDLEYKISLLTLNSAINPLAYSFFKRDINKEIRRSVFCYSA